MLNFSLYVILDINYCKNPDDIIGIARKVISGGVDILQLRAKGCADRKIIQIGQAIKCLAQKTKVLFLLNDRADLACAINADGVHLGQGDLPLKEARQILGENKVIGLSTHNFGQAQEAQRQGADYLALGPIFASPTKPELVPIGLKAIAQIKNKIKIPLLAVGGINLSNVDYVLAEGAEAVAVSSAILTAKDIKKATEDFTKKLL